MTNLQKDFDKTPAEVEIMSPETYEATLRALLTNGSGWGKTQNVGAFELQNIRLETETSSGESETVKDVQVEELYIAFDLNQWPTHEQRKMVVKAAAENWGGRVVRERDLESSDFKGPGFWTVKKGGLAKENGFEYDYLKQSSDDDCSLYAPNPDAARVCLTVDEKVKIPVMWGDFTVEAGGTLAIREAHVAGLVEALASIDRGEKTAIEALYGEDGTVSKFDIYGQEPGFCANNYDEVALKADTEQNIASLTSNQPQTEPASPKNGPK